MFLKRPIVLILISIFLTSAITIYAVNKNLTEKERKHEAYQLLVDRAETEVSGWNLKTTYFKSIPAIFEKVLKFG